ncbi:MAG: DNA polymerase/3'-5' exonuclease PolX [Betaproteobacteria bacterium]|nr:DNA polymerase/3'-5' exonuclease PolX [Betaproteobacteria bacterium]
MPVVNATIAAVLDEIANLLDIQGANAFRVRAYRNAARTIGNLGTAVGTLLAHGKDLTDLPGIGDDLARKIATIARTGTCPQLERLRADMPAALSELLHVPGLGPKRVKTLWHDLGVDTVEALHQAAREGRVRSVHGFGEKTERRILEATHAHLKRERRFRLDVAEQFVTPLVEYLSGLDGLDRVEPAGSFRRRRDTVGDLDILATAEDGARAIRHLTQYGEVADVVSAGPTRGTVRLRGGLQVDLRVVPPASRGAAMQYFTGSRAHGVALRRLAQSKGLKLNEYGVFAGDRPVAGDTEESVYAALGLAWIPPELREDRGEIEAARTGRLPRLVTHEDLRGDLHVHTKASDGHDSVEAMAKAAAARGLDYIAITDHSQRLTIAGGLDPSRLAKQIDEIARLNERLRDITVLAGTEVDILEDGSLDLPRSLLERLDVVVASVHGHFDLSRARQTRRILRALEHPAVHVLGHPTCRLIDERDPCDLDMQRVIRAAAACGVALEVNASPKRLDLTDLHCRMAKAEGARVAIDSDAHDADDFDNLRFGIGQARRGWLEPADVLNACTLGELRERLKRR